jgi:V8-like Glu-specific endopeptidase
VAVGGAVALVATLATLAAGAPGASAATAKGRGSSAVVRNVRSRADVRAFWTRRRMRNAEPLDVVAVPGQAGTGEGAAGSLSYAPAVGPGSDAAATAGAAGVAATIKGIDTLDPTVFPNSANGIVYGEYHIGRKVVDYRCSGGVVNTDAGNIVLTAGHCAIDPDTGAQATNVIFVPGYRDGGEPFGEWIASQFATTSSWKATAGTALPNEGGDLAMLSLESRPSDGSSVESVVGALGIRFNQARDQTYTQYGYPAQSPYDGSKLYSNTAEYAFSDGSGGFFPNPIAIPSDFTSGASGGPWVVGSHPVALSVTAYYYPSQPGYMYGPYFGSAAAQVYASVGGDVNGSSATGALPSNAFSIVAVRLHRRRGTATLSAWVPGRGSLVLSGSRVWTSQAISPGRGIVRLRVKARGTARRALLRTGEATVRVGVSFRPVGGTSRRRSRTITLVRTLE